LTETIKEPVSRWKELIENDFETSVFGRYPQLESIKQDLYRRGAIYASLSGSGSSLYGIFKRQASLSEDLRKYLIWEGPIQTPAEDGL
jgi:4-diphosphocytidyl-2-C-methyl-D-erythritol kinase